MTRIAYVPHRFKGASLNLIQHADAIIAEYSAQGFTLTLRQLYYQFVSRDLIANNMREYKRLGSVINDARLAGLLDWDMIEDRTRTLRRLPHWRDPADIIASARSGYRIDFWSKQPIAVEVWIEKDALLGVVEPVCNEFRVPYFACRGYTSQSEQWEAGQRLSRRWRERKQRTLVLHLGDHDPSGMDMSRDNRERLELFTRHHCGRVPFTLNRIALNMDQVEEHNPPPNPAKLTDSRADGYIEQYGADSWELDALDPTTIDRLIRAQITHVIENEAWAASELQEGKDKDELELVEENWDVVVQRLRDEE